MATGETHLLAASGEFWSPPSLSDFFPEPLFFEGTPFELSRITAIGMLMTGVLCLIFLLAFRNPQKVPRGIQNVGEVAIELVRVNIVDEIIGKEGRRFTPYLAALFFMILFWNSTGIIPFLNIPASSIIGVTAFLAITSYVVFNWVGISRHGFGSYMSNNLFPPGVPKPLYILLTPIEFFSTFILRPITLALRLMVNMLAGHLMLVLFYSAAWYMLFIYDEPALKPLGLAVYVAGFAFTLFELLVIVIQAYIFTLLTAVYIAGAMTEHH
jgi:F-type H+-transporting ATPase subunit a